MAAAAVTAAALALAAAVSPVGVRGTPQRERIQPLRNRGQALFEEKRYAEAAELFAEVAADAQATAQDLVNLALARYEANEDERALAALERAEQLDARNPAIYYLRGLIERRGGRADSAREAFERAARLDPQDPAILYNLAATLEALGDTARARELYERVAAMGFDVALQHYVSSLYRYGFLLLREGRQQEARPYLERYQRDSRRLSQAQRAPAALEAGRYKLVRVPPTSWVGPVPVREVTLAAAAVPAAPGEVRAARPLRGGARRALVVAAADTAASDSLLLVPARAIAVGDADRDGVQDVALLAAGRVELARGVAEGDRLSLSPPVLLAQLADPRDASWVDADHDGDLDLAVAAGDGLHLLDNRGGGEFVDTTAAAGLAGGPPGLAVAWADFDGDADVDLFLLGEGGARLFSNQRGGRFEQVGAAVGAAPPAGARAVAAEDFDNDGHVDLLFAGAGGLSLLRNDGDGTFRPTEWRQPPGEGGTVAALAVGDLDNDGYLDVALGGAGGIELWHNGGDRWQRMARLDGERLLALADDDEDGAVDLLTADATGMRWYRQQRPLGAWLAIPLQGIKNNLLGVGARVEIKAGGLYQARIVRAGELHVGLGGAPRADVVRVTWPNGIVQNELDVEAGRRLEPIVEVERLEGSCPLLYSWDGRGWRFVNEVLGVAPLGMPLARDVIHPPDDDEYVPVPGEALRARDGRLQLRLTEELRETGYVDSMRLLAVDHPRGTRVVPDEKFVAPPHPQFRLFFVRERHAVRARDGEGREWSEQLAAVDGRWTRPFEAERYEGLATPHELVLTLAGAGEATRLYLTGWVYWATGSVNLAVDEDPRVAFEPVSLAVPDGAGGWRTVIEDIGLPNGKNSTLVVDLTGLLDPADPRVRLRTTLRLYWDEAFFTSGAGSRAPLAPRGVWRDAWGTPNVGDLPLYEQGAAEPAHDLRLTVLAPARADLRFRGFSRLQRGRDGFETFAYEQTVTSAPWEQHRGRYTRYGPVSELLAAADDLYVIVGTGDELSVEFPARLPPLPAGWRRDWLVYLNGWVKDGDPNTLHGDRVEPLPFHAMSGYPYGEQESYPDTPATRAWQARYNTRPARRINPPLIGALPDPALPVAPAPAVPRPRR